MLKLSVDLGTSDDMNKAKKWKNEQDQLKAIVEKKKDFSKNLWLALLIPHAEKKDGSKQVQLLQMKGDALGNWTWKRNFQ